MNKKKDIDSALIVEIVLISKFNVLGVKTLMSIWLQKLMILKFKLFNKHLIWWS